MHYRKQLLFLSILCTLFISVPTTVEPRYDYCTEQIVQPYAPGRRLDYRPRRYRLHTQPCHQTQRCVAKPKCKKQEIWPEWFPMEQRTIHGRMYTKHALERMAPDIPPVRLELERRALALGYPYGSAAFTNYVTPRGVSPATIERAIKRGTCIPGKKNRTRQYEYRGIRVITNEAGHIITVIRLR